MSGPACNKCRQEAGHLGDSWCLCCSAVEALSGELRANWGGAGTARWLLTSCRAQSAS